MPPPRAVRRLTMKNLPPESTPQLSPSPERAASPSPVAGRRSAGIAHRSLLPVQDGGVRAAERATPRAREGRQLAQRHKGCARVRRAVVLPNAAPPPPTRINLNTSWTRTLSTAVRAGDAGVCRQLRVSRTRMFMCTRTTRACSRCYYATGLQEGGERTMGTPSEVSH